MPHPRSADGPGPTVLPVFGGDLDTAAWRRRHARGEVPDAVPYGLDRLTGHGWRLVGDAGGWHRAGPARRARGVVRRLGGGVDWVLAAAPLATADAVLSWDERTGVPLALRHGHRVPVVTNVIWTTDAPPRPGPLRRAVAAGLGRAARLVVLSSAQVPALAEHFGVRAERVAVVPFGVDADFFTPAGGGADPDLVVSVGNDRDRDWPTALAALAHVRRHRPATRAVVVSSTADAGRGAEGVELVRHLGHGELRGLLGTATALLVCTRPNLHASGITAVLEALATGRPAVASATPGMADYATPGGGLTLVRPGDATAAGEALLALLRDPARAADDGAAGRRSVELRFSTARQAAHLAAVLDEAVERS